MEKDKFSCEGSEKQYGPRHAGAILHDRQQKCNEPCSENTSDAMEQGWKRNTDICMDVKTFLRSDRITNIGKDYPGVLTRDNEDHYTFVETVSNPAPEIRNPRVYAGEYITVTCNRKDGSYRPNFKPMRVGRDFNVDGYAIGVYDELRKALNGLIEK